MRSKGRNTDIVVGIVEGLPRSEIASRAGISARTLRRRLQDPSVVRAIADARLEVHERLTAELGRLAFRAVDQLGDVVVAGETDPARVSAARVALDQFGSYSRSLEAVQWSAKEAEQEERLARLERAE